jgi:hypothetical protein
MQKTIFTLLFITNCIANGTLIFAQNNNVYRPTRARDCANATSFIGTFANYSMPLGTKWNTSDYADPASGFAADYGLGGGLEGAYFFDTNFGIGGNAFYNAFGTQKANNLAEGYRLANRVDSCTVLQKGGYTQIGALVGPVFTVPGEFVSLDIHAFGGVINTETPETSVFFSKNTTPALLQNKANNLAFAWQAGVALRLHFSEYVSMGIRADYVNTTPDFTFKNTATTTFLGRKNDTYSQNISTINAGLSLYYDFTK